ncbi:MAG: hypothetical protein AB7O92_04470 [Acidimicrobiia bacterium]
MDASLEPAVAGRRRRVAAALAFSLVAGAVSLLSPLTSRLPHLPAPVHLRARRSD